MKINNVDNTKQTIISIATGSGGLERGLELAGLELQVAAYVEIEAFIIENLVTAMETNHLATTPIWADIKTFPYRYFYKKIHGITAGYPCPPFSNAGHRKGENDPRHLWPYIYRIVQSVRPVWCFFENVEGHISLGYEEISRDLRKIGYKVEEGIFSAEEVGAPHQRKRLFILAIMAHSDSNATAGGHRDFQEETKEIKRTEQRKNRKRMWSQFEHSSKDVADTYYKRLQRFSCQKFNCLSKQEKTSKGCKSCAIYAALERWPALPEQKQYKWEEPRTIESGMGCTTDGYDYRPDLLRMYGNGVVPQTAAKAFLTLLSKF